MRWGQSPPSGRLGSGRFSSLSRMRSSFGDGAAGVVVLAVDTAHQEPDLLDVGFGHLHRLAEAGLR